MTTETRIGSYINPPNHLKQKVGSGGISETTLNRGQNVIDKGSFDFLPQAKKYLDHIREQVNVASNDNVDISEFKERVINPVMQLKANGGMFKYQLITDVADVALRFLEAIEHMNKDVITIISAHETSLRAIVKKGRASEESKNCHDLVSELNDACIRYFRKHGK